MRDSRPAIDRFQGRLSRRVGLLPFRPGQAFQAGWMPFGLVAMSWSISRGLAPLAGM